jgi:inorganic pyrophosphatase
VLIEVFVENEAGKASKNLFDEKTLVWAGAVPVSRPYPYPYGFVIGTTAPDGDNVDCFIITSAHLSQGRRVLCKPIGLMEQLEDGAVDHNILAVLADEDKELSEAAEDTLRDFVTHVFEYIPGKKIAAGAFLPATAAVAYVSEHADQKTAYRETAGR